MKRLALILTIVLASCTNPQAKQLLFKIEARNISEDKITEFRFFDSGLVEKTIIHDSKNNQELFKTSFSQKQAQTELLNKLQELDYHNHFPWKQDFYKRGDVYKVQFAKRIKAKYINEPKQDTELLVNKSYFFYSGDENAPDLLQELIKLTK